MRTRSGLSNLESEKYKEVPVGIQVDQDALVIRQPDVLHCNDSHREEMNAYFRKRMGMEIQGSQYFSPGERGPRKLASDRFYRAFELGRSALRV